MCRQSFAICNIHHDCALQILLGPRPSDLDELFDIAEQLLWILHGGKVSTRLVSIVMNEISSRSDPANGSRDELFRKPRETHGLDVLLLWLHVCLDLLAVRAVELIC